MHMHMSQKMRDTSMTQKQRNAFSWVWTGNKGYHLYDLHKSKVFYSSNVKLNESEKENETEMNNHSKIVYHMDLDFSDDNQATTEVCPVE